MEKLVLAIAIVLMATAVYADQTIEVKVPDSFTAQDIEYVKELASVGIQRVLEKPLVPPVKDVEAVKIEIDRIRKANNLLPKFEVKEIE